MKNKVVVSVFVVLANLFFLNSISWADSALTKQENKVAYEQDKGIILRQSPKAAVKIQAGDKVIVYKLDSFIANVKNVDGVKSGDGLIKFNDSCYIMTGGIIEVVGLKGDKLLLVKYMSPDYRDEQRPSCPCETIFIIERTKFAAMDRAYKENLRALEKEKEDIRRLLNKK